MKQVLIIPDREHLHECLEMAKKYGFGFEYNDFYAPELLDDEDGRARIIEEYIGQDMPEYTTFHGAFYDVIPFSPDVKVREVAELRIEQSMETARRVKAKAVVFHTNYNPGLNSEEYIQSWIKTNEAYWGRVLEKYPDMGIYLENTFEANPDILEALSKKLCRYDNYGVCFDYAHASLSPTPPEIWAERLGRFVKHVHINDNDGKSDLHLAWGDGVIDRVKFYECYDKYLRGATVLIETISMESKIRSLEVLKREGFM